jgi:hypothetical protein
MSSSSLVLVLLVILILFLLSSSYNERFTPDFYNSYASTNDYANTVAYDLDHRFGQVKSSDVTWDQASYTLADEDREIVGIISKN